jgi:hypothetical protein
MMAVLESVAGEVEKAARQRLVRRLARLKILD